MSVLSFKSMAIKKDILYDFQKFSRLSIKLHLFLKNKELYMDDVTQKKRKNVYIMYVQNDYR